MQFHKYRKLHERSMISIFSYIEIVWLTFFHKPKLFNFYILIVAEHKGHEPWLLKRSNQRFGCLALKMHWKQPEMF